MKAAIVLFTRDLRVHDNPALAATCAAAERVVPLFVRDPAVPSSPVRDRFLAESLADLRGTLRSRGGDLVVRTGDPVDEAVRLAREVAATGIAVMADASRYATRRAARLRRERASTRTAPTSGGTSVWSDRTCRTSPASTWTGRCATGWCCVPSRARWTTSPRSCAPCRPGS